MQFQFSSYIALPFFLGGGGLGESRECEQIAIGPEVPQNSDALTLVLLIWLMLL